MKFKIMSIFLFSLGIGANSQSTNELYQKTKEIVVRFQKSDFKGIEACFDETMKTVVPATKLEEFWLRCNKQYGKFVKPTTMSDTIENQYRIVYTVMVFEKSSLKMKTGFDAKGKVVGLLFEPITKEANNQPKEELYQKAKEIAVCLQKSDFKGIEAYYDETMRTAFPAQKLQEFWLGLNQQVGKFVKPSTMSDTVYNQYQIVYTIMIFERSKLKMKTIFDGKGKLSGFFIVPENAPKP